MLIGLLFFWFFSPHPLCIYIPRDSFTVAVGPDGKVCSSHGAECCWRCLGMLMESGSSSEWGRRIRQLAQRWLGCHRCGGGGTAMTPWCTWPQQKHSWKLAKSQTWLTCIPSFFNITRTAWETAWMAGHQVREAGGDPGAGGGETDPRKSLKMLIGVLNIKILVFLF